MASTERDNLISVSRNRILDTILRSPQCQTRAPHCLPAATSLQFLPSEKSRRHLKHRPRAYCLRGAPANLNSTDSSCCNTPCLVLASNRMVNLYNSNAEQEIGTVGANSRLLQHKRRRSAQMRLFPYSPATVTARTPRLLDFELNRWKQRTSPFLIDNLNGFSMKPFTLSEVEGSRHTQFPSAEADRHPIATPKAFAAKRACPPKRFIANAGPASSIEPSISRSPNRQSAELESSLSYRKQRTQVFLIAKFGALFPLRPPKHAPAKAGPARRTSNRPSPRLELLLSCSKQRIELISNRPRIAFVNFLLNSRRPCVSPN